MRRKLYEQCPACYGNGRSKMDQVRPGMAPAGPGPCIACRGKGFVEIGLTQGQVERMAALEIATARRYLGDSGIDGGQRYKARDVARTSSYHDALLPALYAFLRCPLEKPAQDDVHPGDLALNPEGYFGIVLSVMGGCVGVFVGNGTAQIWERREIHAFTLPSSPAHASFGELLGDRSTRFVNVEPEDERHRVALEIVRRAAQMQHTGDEQSSCAVEELADQAKKFTEGDEKNNG